MIPLKDLNPARATAYVTIALIALNVLTFFWQQSHRGEAGELLFYRYGTIPKCFLAQGNRDKHEAALNEALERLAIMEISQGLRARGIRADDPRLKEQIADLVAERTRELREKVGTRHEWLTVFSSMFMHGGFLHILGNMWFLWIFGNNIEDACGRWRFAVFYTVCGLVATFAHILSAPGSVVPSIGASGAISGVLGAYLMLFPRAQILSLIPLGYFFWWQEVPAWVFLGVWALIQWISGLSALGRSVTTGVAWFAHIGGFTAGLGLIYLLRRPKPPVPVAPERFGYDSDV